MLKIYLIILACLYQVSAQNITASEEDECAAIPLEEYNLGFRIASIFILLGTSSLGTYTPILLHRISPYKQGDIREWLLTIGKFFGTGVILATAFVHMLPDALENFNSPCLTSGWLSYGAFAGVFCMGASFALQLLEVATVAHVNRLRARQPDLEHQINTPQSEDTNEKKMVVTTTAAGETIQEAHNISSIQQIESVMEVCNHSHIDHHHIGDDHGHVHTAFLEDDNAYKHIGTYILELGIVMHSILIGITLATTANSGFVTLLIALVFHQFFEGMALGTRLNEIGYKKWYKPVAMGLLYTIMTPIGIAIGIGIRSKFNSNSYSSVLASAILDSLSAGILLYNAYVNLMSMEMSHNTAFHNAPTTRKIYSFVSMYLGAALMSLLGAWA